MMMKLFYFLAGVVAAAATAGNYLAPVLKDFAAYTIDVGGVFGSLTDPYIMGFTVTPSGYIIACYYSYGTNGLQHYGKFVFDSRCILNPHVLCNL